MTNSGVAGWVVAGVLAAILFGEAMATRSIFDRHKNQSEKNYRSDYYCSTKTGAINGKIAAPSNSKGNEGGGEKSEYELCQQWRAAEAAEEAAIVAWIQLPLSLIGLACVAFATVYAAKSARHAGDSAKSALESVDIAQKTARRQLRAYVGYSRAQVVNFHSGVPIIEIEVKNFGDTPAYDVTARFTAGMGPVAMAIPLLSLPEERSEFGVFNPGGHGNLRLPLINPSPSESDRSAVTAGRLAVYLYAELAYRDCFDVDQRTTFHVFYTGGPHGSQDGAMAHHPIGNTAT